MQSRSHSQRSNSSTTTTHIHTHARTHSYTHMHCHAAAELPHTLSHLHMHISCHIHCHTLSHTHTHIRTHIHCQTAARLPHCLNATHTWAARLPLKLQQTQTHRCIFVSGQSADASRREGGNACALREKLAVSTCFSRSCCARNSWLQGGRRSGEGEVQRGGRKPHQRASRESAQVRARACACVCEQQAGS